MNDERTRGEGVPESVTPASSRRDETDFEKYDRNWNDILQELRVMQTGTQIVTAFLIVLPFQSRFAALVTGLEGWYLTLLIAAVLLTVIMFLPVLIHRRLFRAGIKYATVAWGDRLVKIALGGLAILLAGCVAFVAAVTVPGPVAWWAAGGTALVIAALMIVPQFSLLSRHAPDER